MLVLSNEKIIECLHKEIKESLAKFSQVLSLHIIQVGNNDCCSKYVSIKQKLGKKFGFKVVLHRFIQASDEQLLQVINDLNYSDQCNGIIVQLPLPPENNSKKIINSISYLKDVDCFNFSNSDFCFNLLPPVVSSVKAIINSYNLSLQNKTVLLIGKGDSAGIPLLNWLMKRPITLIVCDKHEKNLERFFSLSDFVISAVGKAKFIDNKKLVKKNYFFDVGTSVCNGNICGDLDYSNFSQAQFSGYTPTPGGIGGLTTAFLVKNLIYLSKKQFKK